MEGSVKVNDLPRIWNERMAAYLGCTPKDDAQGVLQASEPPRLQPLTAYTDRRHRDDSVDEGDLGSTMHARVHTRPALKDD